MDGEFLRENDAAFVLSDDGTCELYIPEADDDDVTPAHVLFVTSIMMRLHDDPDFYRDQMNWIRSRMDRKSAMVN